MATKHKKDSGSQRRRSRSSLSKSGKYFRDNPKAAAKKDAYNRKAKKGKVGTKVERQRKRADAKKKGKNIDNKDYDHATRSFVSAKVNRGRGGEGNRKKKK